MNEEAAICCGKNANKPIAINKSSYPNTVSIIKDARARAASGRYSEALALYIYADDVVDIEKEPILKRKIIREKENIHKVIDHICERRLQELERQQVKKIKALYEKSIACFKADKLVEAEKGFKDILALDLDHEDAQNYVDKLIPLRAEAIKVELQQGKERRQARRLALLGDRKWEQKEIKGPLAIDPSQPRVMVREIQFSGSSIFDDKFLAEIVQSDVGKELTLPELRLLADRVQDFYRDSGYFLSQVVIPQQDINGQKGIVKFTIFEGKLGEIIVRGNERFVEESVLETLSEVYPGEPILKQDLERSLLVLNSHSGIETSSVLQAGKETGTTNLIVDVTEKKRVEGSVAINNFGSKNTGKYRISPELSFPNLTGRGDLLDIKYITALDSTDMYYGRTNYMTPIGSDGFQLKAYASKGSFPVGEEFAVLDIKSDTFSWGLGGYYPYFLSPTTSISSELWFEYVDLEQTMLGTKTMNDHIRKVRLDLLNFDKQGLEGRTLLTLGAHLGLGEKLGGMDRDSDLSSRSFAKADNGFTKIVLGAARSQIITENLLMVGRLSGQYSFDPLVAGEQWSVGGINSVHGHQASVFLGDDGLTANLEARLTLASTKNSIFQMLFFADHGIIHIKKPFITQNSSEQISGVGIGFYADISKMFEARLNWGVPLGTNTGDDHVLYFETRCKF